MDANLFTVRTLSILYIISFLGVCRNYISNHLSLFAPNYFNPWGPTRKGQPIGFYWQGVRGQRRSNKFYLQFLPDAVLYPARREHIMFKTFLGHKHSFKIAFVGSKGSGTSQKVREETEGDDMFNTIYLGRLPSFPSQREGC